jgi:hypothetical protein
LERYKPDVMLTAISYTRVSTSKQGQSGLGLEAQQAAIEAFCAQHGYEIAARCNSVRSTASGTTWRTSLRSFIGPSDNPAPALLRSADYAEAFGCVMAGRFLGHRGSPICKGGLRQPAILQTGALSRQGSSSFTAPAV